ncbi:MAG TPA: hypothetical protein VKL21_08090 [Candidatus Methanoperedens sp.]|nr:hypothetical protein [Candidatus Methanoperedens sp.]
MGEKSIKEIMDERFGVHQIPKRQVSREEMNNLIAEAKERGRTKSERKKITENEERTDKSGNPCPKCASTNWNFLPDNRKYCWKCGFVEEPEKITCEFKCDICGKVIQFPGKNIEVAREKAVLHKDYDSNTECEGIFKFERQVEAISSISEPIKETEKNMGKILFPFHCNLCGIVVQFQATNPEIAMEKAIPHKKYDPKTNCDGTFTLLKHINPDEIRKRPVIPRESIGISDKFYHPKSDKFICGGCYDLNQCLQTSHHMEICLDKNIDLKLKTMLEILSEILKILSKNKMAGE